MIHTLQVSSRLIINLFLIIFLNFNLYAQKFRTIEQYQEYFISNYISLDEIEGIWQGNSKINSTSIYGDHVPSESEEGIIAIIKEGNIIYQYKLVDGVYSPSKVTVKYNKGRNYYARTAYFDACDEYVNSNNFTIKNNKFSIKENVTRVLNCQANRSIVRKSELISTYSRIFPLESDIINSPEASNSIGTQGTAFAISREGYIVTNYHVIQDAKTINIRGINGDYHKSYNAHVEVSDKNNDLVILKIDGITINDLEEIPFAIKQSASEVGENIYVLGYPLTATMGEEIKLTDGIISSKSGFQGDITSYQMTAPIQPGNSGAPLFDENGNIIGIVSAKHLETENVGYAIKTSYLFNLLDATSIQISEQKNNILVGESLSNQVKLIKDFVYIIEAK